MKYIYLAGLVSVLLVMCCVLISCAGKRPKNIGVAEGRLSLCPEKPNCVSSISTEEKHAIRPFTYESGKDQAYEALLRVISNQERATITVQKGDYLHIEFKSKLFGFVDDVEFYFPMSEPLIHVRSASRVGYSDLGVNRKRIETLRVQFADAVKGLHTEP